MARFIGLLMIAPWLVILGFLYWFYARHRATHGVPAGWDIGVLVVAVISTVGFSIWAFVAGAHTATQPFVNPIWKYVAAAWAAYPAYFVVLFLGLARHWLAGWRQVAK